MSECVICSVHGFGDTSVLSYPVDYYLSSAYFTELIKCFLHLPSLYDYGMITKDPLTYKRDPITIPTLYNVTVICC